MEFSCYRRLPYIAAIHEEHGADPVKSQFSGSAGQNTHNKSLIAGSNLLKGENQVRSEGLENLRDFSRCNLRWGELRGDGFDEIPQITASDSVP
jgi:hypothetical protein